MDPIDNPPKQWYGEGFGWTTTREIANWFNAEFAAYEQDKSLKLRAMKAFRHYPPKLPIDLRDELASVL